MISGRRYVVRTCGSLSTTVGHRVWNSLREVPMRATRFRDATPLASRLSTALVRRKEIQEEEEEDKEEEEKESRPQAQALVAD